MTPQSGSRVADALSESGRILHDAVAGISEDDAVRRPDPERWSVRDCVEHLVVAEHALLRRITAANPDESLPRDSAREARVTAAVVNREAKIDAPGRAHPAGRFPTLAAAIEAFDIARGESIAFACEQHGNLVQRMVQHPLFGPVTGIEMLLIMAGHARRHAEQIREIRGSIT